MRASYGKWRYRTDKADLPTSLAEVIAGDVGLEDRILLRIDLERFFASMIRILTARELDILLQRICRDDGDGVSYADIGEELGISTERVRQVYQRALARLRHNLADPTGYEYPDQFLTRGQRAEIEKGYDKAECRQNRGRWTVMPCFDMRRAA